MSWPRPQRACETWSQALGDELPKVMEMRIVRFRVAVPGFRTRAVEPVTTLLDEERYGEEQIAALYLRRWSVELFFRDIKTALGVDLLRCLSPELIGKEVHLQAIAYNRVRALMLETAWTRDVAIARSESALRAATGRFATSSSPTRPAKRFAFAFSVRRVSRVITNTRLSASRSAVLLRHVLKMKASGRARLTWPLFFGPLNDALIEDSLATAEASLGLSPQITKWSARVRFLRWIASGGRAPRQQVPNPTPGS